MKTALTAPFAHREFPIVHPSDIAMARRCGLELASLLDFDETKAGKVAIAITELATNIIRHARDGCLLLMPMQPASGVKPQRLEILALDRGPGIADLAHSMRDGVSSMNSPSTDNGASTMKSAGMGLGATVRLSDDFDVYSLPGKGTGFYLCFWPGAPPGTPGPIQEGAVCRALAGQEVCGDTWSIESDAHSARFMVCDGLGHGPAAAQASAAAVETLHNHSLPPGEMVQATHQAMRGTRGAALGVAELTFSTRELRFAGIGNISACVVDETGRKHLISHNGIVGHHMRTVREETSSWTGEALCILHSDGLGTHWSLDDYPGLGSRHPALIAGILYRDHARERDDVTVLIVKRTEF